MQQPPAPLHRKHSLPKWLIAVNVVMMLPILAEPLVFYASIFIFDNPHNMPLAMLVFFAINSYSLVLAGCAALSIRLYRRTGKAVLALLPHVLSTVVIVLLFA